MISENYTFVAHETFSYGSAQLLSYLMSANFQKKLALQIVIFYVENSKTDVEGILFGALSVFLMSAQKCPRA